jgi:hypothetical protein
LVEEVDAKAGVAVESRSWPQLWLAAVTRPTIVTYRAIVGDANIGPGHAYLWLLGSSVFSGILVSSAAAWSGSEPAVGSGLVVAILIFAISATLACVAFAGLVHGIARLFLGSGSYRNLMNVSAAFNAPLILVASVLSVVPRGSVVASGLYVYWLYLNTVAIRAVHDVGRAKAVGAAVVPLLLLGGAVLGVVLAIIS